MFEGQLLIDKSAGNSYKILSPWFARGGDYATFTVDVIEETMLNAGGVFDIDIYTKRDSDAGSGTLVTTGGTGSFRATAAGQTPFFQDAGMKDWVRFEFTMPGGHEGEWILFRMLRPQWHNAV